MTHAWTHAWCRDPSRDERVRAAEDGRTGPLPTLEECIETAFSAGVRDSFRKVEEAWAMIPKSVSASSPVDEENKGDGMRTERITLEFEVERGSPPSEWPWSYILSRSDALKMRPGESVRVVDTHAEAVAESVAWEGARDAYRGRILRLTEERDAAIREREELRDSLNRCPECNGEGQHDSGGMDASGEWINLPCDGCRSTGKMQGYVQATDKLRARVAELEAAQAASGGGEQPRGWLTERDTKTLIDAAVFLSGKGERGMSEAIEWLLARSTPPEVVKPNEKHYHHITCSSRDADWLAALAAAGVEVKEVG